MHLGRLARGLVAAGLFSALALGCKTVDVSSQVKPERVSKKIHREPPPTDPGLLALTGDDPGALVKLQMDSTVGVLLDEIPAGPLREAAAAEVLARPNAFWEERAKQQTKLTYYRLVFRGLYYSSDWGNASKVRGPLPLPPRKIWNVDLKGAPRRDTSNNHDLIVVDYTFKSHILAAAGAPAGVEPNLAEIGGTWAENFSLPTDPNLLLERSGYACISEEEYPLGSVFEENTHYFYDDTCIAGSKICHLTVIPKESCDEALNKHHGIVKTAMNFTRLPWDAALANSVRVGTITNTNGAQLQPIPEDMVDERKVFWRYFAPGSCEIEEGVIGKLGWRRLLAFSASVQNNGTEMIHIGVVNDPNSPWQKAHIFEWSACHKHYHFSHYGIFGFQGVPGSKRAFCLEDTNRFHNDELAPLWAVHQSCNYQGMTNGWGDEYQFGLAGQWIDITGLDTSKPQNLTFFSNKDGFLCEGKVATDANGTPLFEPTAFKTAQGETVSRVKCNWAPNWDADNLATASVVSPSSSPKGSFVTEPCDRGQVGPLRNCGFTETSKSLHTCTPGASVTLSCTAKTATQVLRVCEKTAASNTGVACTVGSAPANSVINTTATPVTFTCPAVRDATGSVGGYSTYQTAVVPSQIGGSVTCTGTGW